MAHPLQDWTATIEACGWDRWTASQAANALTGLYTNPDRHYHNWKHIVRMLSAAERFPTIGITSRAKIAILFHDAIFDPKRPGVSEMASAEFMRSMLTVSTGVNMGALEFAVSTILATSQHAIEHDAVSRDRAIVLDLDLEGFADPRTEYMQSTRDLYAEVLARDEVPKKEFIVKRREFLAILNKRSHLYYVLTDLEDRARENIRLDLEGKDLEEF